MPSALYLDGQISLGCIPSASAMRFSFFGKLRTRVTERLDDPASPCSLAKAVRVMPFLRSAQMTSAESQSACLASFRVAVFIVVNTLLFNDV